MRFKDLNGLTSLPIGLVKRRFRGEDVITVLPVTAEDPERVSLLAATPSKLALVTGEAPDGVPWMTHWAPWDAVDLTDAEAPDAEAPDAEDGAYGLTVRIGKLTFHARLTGPAGRRALRDFIDATRSRRAALAAT